MDDKVEKNNYSTNVLKVIYTLLIIVAHTAMYTKSHFINCNSYDNSFFYSVIKLLSTTGNTADLIFLVISLWFFIDTNSINNKKIIKIITDVFIISIISLLVGICVFHKSFSAIEIKKFFFPNIYGECWYISCYIVLYVLHPLLNSIINIYSIKRCYIISIIYYLLNLLFSTEILGFCELSYFISVYFIVAYYKRTLFCVNNKNRYLCLFIFMITIYSIMVVVLNKFCSRVDFFSPLLYKLTNIYSPFHLIIAILLISLFRCYVINNKIVNYLSGFSGLSFIFHVFCSKAGLFDYYILIISSITNNMNFFFLYLFFCIFISISVMCFAYTLTIQKASFKLSDFINCLIIKNEKENYTD